MRRLFFPALILLASTAWAGNRLDIVRVAFSPSSHRVVAVTSGELDGSGFGAAQIDVLNTSSGATVYTVQKDVEEATAPAVLAQVLTSAPVVNIFAQSGLNPGVTSVPRYRRVYSTGYASWSDGIGAGQRRTTSVSLWTAGVFAPIKLDVFRLPSKCPQEYFNPGDVASGFRLSVRGRVVYQDKVLPAARSCAARYSLERVDVRGNRALFTLRAYGIGFEGPDADPVFVAVTLK
ncbi:DUF2259 domain-containing protein [Deinococcus puniceus]|uniref:Uncharacterized protein n=1 Tax=Deinococcus puniceus TaxID=1182568 RepID=A0A172T9H4_9DEIO|nr:DUF2259 domain-containing protein [Deinococcus puniceus]ANE43660.1 hypothetical protein SU48_07645 [Deinococcus puniceus]